MDPQRPLFPQQNRSRATAQRLLVATIRVIDQSGLDAATVPGIAAVAKVAPASVYRRYANKDALIRAAFLYALEQSHETNRQVLKGLLLKETLEATAKQLMALLLQQYRQHPVLFRSLSRYIDTTDDREFIRRARSIVAANAEEVITVLLHHRDEVAHAKPELALRFALLHATCSIEVYALDANSLWHEYDEFSGDKLIAETARSFLAYLRNDHGLGERRSPVSRKRDRAKSRMK